MRPLYLERFQVARELSRRELTRAMHASLSEPQQAFDRAYMSQGFRAGLVTANMPSQGHDIRVYMVVARNFIQPIFPCPTVERLQILEDGCRMICVDVPSFFWVGVGRRSCFNFRASIEDPTSRSSLFLEGQTRCFVMAQRSSRRNVMWVSRLVGALLLHHGDLCVHTQNTHIYTFLSMCIHILTHTYIRT